MKKTKVSFFEFSYLWFRINNMSLPKHQRKMVLWLLNIWKKEEDRKALLMAFRNSGKSTIVGLFCVWVLYMNSSSRILVVAADHDLAKKMVRNVKRIIEKHPLTNKMKPSKREQWASDQFTINRNTELRDPSMLAKGLGANLTGLRADIIICDDVEVPKNCDSIMKRNDLRDKLGELDYILTPNGMQLYIGTPHTFYTIYQNKYCDREEQKPFLLGFALLKIPIIDVNGNSNWVERFSNEKIASIRQRSGEAKFLSQMMLEPNNIKDSVLNPDSLRVYREELKLMFSNGCQILKIGDRRVISSSCWWDPSFASGDKADNSVVACVFCDEEGKYWLHDVCYIKIDENSDKDEATQQCEIVADFITRNYLPSIRIETNGIGKFLPGILKKTLISKGARVSVLDAFSSVNKEKKILEAFEVLLANKALNVNRKIWETSFIEEMREWSPSSKNKDDALDAVASCLLSQPVMVSSYSSAKSNSYNWQGKAEQFEANTFFEI